jgi:DNA-directed RNA polymerase specialized sigma24 family protein
VLELSPSTLIMRYGVRDSLEYSRSFCARFSRCRRLLHLVACRVLEGTESADEAVQNCFLAARRKEPEFQDEGAFRSWLLRVLIDEALQIRYREQFLHRRIPGRDAPVVAAGMTPKQNVERS